MVLFYLLGLLWLGRCLADPHPAHLPGSGWNVVNSLSPTIPYGYASPGAPYQPSLVLQRDRKDTVYYVTTRTIYPTGATKYVSTFVKVAATYASTGIIEATFYNLDGIDRHPKVVTNAIDDKEFNSSSRFSPQTATSSMGLRSLRSLAHGVASIRPVFSHLAATRLRYLFKPAKASAKSGKEPAKSHPQSLTQQIETHRHPPPRISHQACEVDGISPDSSRPQLKYSESIKEISFTDFRDETRQTIDALPKIIPIQSQLPRVINGTTRESVRTESTMLLFQVSTSLMAIIASYKLPAVYPVGRTTENLTRIAYFVSTAFAILYGFRVVGVTWSSLSDIKDMLYLLKNDGTYGHVWLPTKQMVMDTFTAYNQESIRLGAVYAMEAVVMGVSAVILRFRLNATQKFSGCELWRSCFLGLATGGSMCYLAVQSWQSIVSCAILWAHWVHRPLCYVLYLASKVFFCFE
ncbi:hypothetical protein TWF281_010370 [Arthrobotrys megalospora]